MKLISVFALEDFRSKTQKQLSKPIFPFCRCLYYLDWSGSKKCTNVNGHDNDSSNIGGNNDDNNDAQNNTKGSDKTNPQPTATTPLTMPTAPIKAIQSLPITATITPGTKH